MRCADARNVTMRNDSDTNNAPLILVVENDDHIRMLLARILRHAGFLENHNPDRGA